MSVTYKRKEVLKMNLLNMAYYSPKIASLLGGIISRDEEWDFIKGGGDGTLDGVTNKVKAVGAEGYNLIKTIGIICLSVCILLVAIAFMFKKTAQEKKENKDWIFWLCIGGAILFGGFSIISMIAGVGRGI